MDVLVQNNTRKTCRTCMRVHNSRKEMVSIFEVDQTFPAKRIKFSEMLLQIVNHPVHEHDDLPKRICVLCLQAIRSSYFFKIQAEKSYSIQISRVHSSMLAPGVFIKRENTVQQANLPPLQQQPAFPSLILSPRIVGGESFGDDLLMEIGSPKIQEQFTNGGAEEEEEDSDDQQIIDYEPDFSDSESHGEPPHSEGCGKSPDSGIIDDRAHETIYERQIAESQVKELQNLVCDICQKQMFSSKALARHKRNAHSESKCKFCKKRLGNYNYLKMHMKFKHPKHYDAFRLNGQTNAVVEIIPILEIPECLTCGTKLVDREALIRHHADCDWICVECNLQLAKRDSYVAHMNKEHKIQVQDQPSLECPFNCIETFTSEKTLQAHIQRSHPDYEDTGDDDSVSNDSSLFDCPHCTSRFSNKRSLSQHIGSKHKSQAQEQPKVRNAPKYTRDEFIDKFLVRKSTEYFRCIPCQKDIRRRSLKLHLRGKHAAMKSYFCELCPEGFFRSDYRQRHMAHVHFSQYRCNDCDVQFDRAFKYDTHMLQHGVPAKNFKPDEGNDAYDLDNAKMKFIEDSSTFDYEATTTMAMMRRPSVMGAPTQVAQVELPMAKDEFCEKYLINLSDKFTHCSICQQKMMKGSIISHILWKHAVKKPLKCAFCNERVVKNAARLVHMARCHPNDYNCVECRQQFSKHDQYAGHMKEYHGVTVTSKPSSGEEDDLTIADVRFVGQKNEDEVINEPDGVYIEPEAKEDTGEVHQCQFCHKSFTSAKNLQIHKTHKHRSELVEPLNESSSKFQQDYSDGEPMTFGEFRQNYVEVVNTGDLRCLVCDHVMRKKNYANHIKSRHATTGAYRCAICPEAFFRPEHRMQHMSSAHRGMFFCNCCNIQFYQNSRYAKHMKELHEIDVDSSDNYEVDLSLADLRFLPQVKPGVDDDQQSVSSSFVEEEQEEPQTSTGAFSRDEFITRYVKNLNRDNRKCEACNRVIAKNSLYNHLMRYHALTLPFKCPFCDLRLERGQYRMRHISIFHPNDYKCHECGLQFQTHAKFAEHMLVEHNTTDIPEKSAGEEPDMSSLDIKYVVNRISDEDWQEAENEEQPEPEVNVKSEFKEPHEFLKPWVKGEPKEREVVENSLLEETEVEEYSEYNYVDFKTKFVVEEDTTNVRCIPCDRVILRTSVCAHLRLWHAITMCYNCELCDEGFQRVDYRQRHMKFTHPDDFKCEHCQVQFHRSVLYKQHMAEGHNIRIEIEELKTKDEIDLPLENMKFVEHVPDSIRLHENDGDTPKRGARMNKTIEPINPCAGGLTYEEFNNQYIRAFGDNFKCNVCRVSMTKFSVKKHLKRYHATSQAFYCELCPEGFQRPDLRVAHMETAHHDSFRCFQCNIQFYLSSSYVEHMQTQHNLLIRVLSSKNKSEVDVPLDRLRFIPQRLNNDDSTPIPKTVATPSPKKLKKNFDDIPDDIELTREQFFAKFFRSIKNDAATPGEKKSKCLACLKVFSSKNRLFHAMHNHAIQRPFKCELCPQKFFISAKRGWHMNRFHPDDYRCSICNVQFDRAYQFIDHMQEDHNITLNISVPDPDTINVPSDVMRYTKKVTAMRTLLKQKRLGISDEPVESPSVSMDSFSFHGEESLKCSECHEEFESGRSLRNHMRNHSNNGEDVKPIINTDKIRELKMLEYTHECDICFKKFAAVFALNAHKKFKHGTEPSGPPPPKRRKIEKEKPKFDVECDICDFKAHRRDYVEHHVKAEHKPEFHCRHCTRILSNFNIFIHHINEHHPKAQENLQRYHKCSECHKAFKTIESMKQHLVSKHGPDYHEPEHRCSVCCVVYRDAAGFEIHNQNHVHKNMVKFIEGNFQDAITWEVNKEGDVSGDVNQFGDVDETGEGEDAGDGNCSVSEHTEDHEPDDTSDPLEKMLERKIQSYERIKSTSEEDKLDYLNFMQTHSGVYTCGICGKTKKVRKHMLHHLKQHDEVPTFQCEKCPEKFVFKRKYEKHLLEHESDNVDEHPKYQDIMPVKNEIKCQICQMTFKLTIMLNRHNTTWHSEDNEFRELPMTDQKTKKEEMKLELAPIKLLRCKHCLQAFIKPLELKEHLRVKHNSESMDQPPDDSLNLLKCEKCNFEFAERRFLENHQKHFCVHRALKSESETTKNVINEQ